ncbi:Di-heme cytochrome c peroxidase [Pseudovibrio axinellae]|uniref:Di-heme cytochrome c peroxidase n=1 Tax=Pseudovibrio axinellae TaxID=989403 RepID=A0A166BDF6_9HYPH|nr:cytochrome c peroxidase [Pseudovibrio axinellae]KZL22152.1 Di-heme cytochrome c peroxidase [Pseudovibrio axinellae]SEQ53247.1 Cytochrome c peroxidase [Pseudovibrio axinellae]
MRSFLLALWLCLLPGMVQATALKEAPWLPEAAAYRLSLFMGNLSPVPWNKLRDSWEQPAPGAAPATPAFELISAPQRDAVDAALKAEDRQAFFQAVTRVIAEQMLESLNASEAALGTAEARQHMLNAQGFYRAFADGIQAGDKKAFSRLGLAWLEMSSALGTEGLLGAGKNAANPAQFKQAKATIAEYVLANYGTKSFSNRAKLTPIPESVVKSGQPVALPVTLPPGSNIANQKQLPLLVLQFESAGGDETELPLVAYGDMLFDSPEIFGSPARDLGMTCSTCHNRSDVNRELFIPGLSSHAGGLDVDGAFFAPMFNDRRDDHIDTPSLRGIRFTAPYGRDGREASLRRFTRNVIVTEFAGAEPTPYMLDALMAYMREFDFLPNSKIDRQGRLTEQASAAAMRGESLFNQPFDGMNGKSCASCHVPEQNFRNGQIYDIGSDEPPFPGGTPMAFDVPTLRSAKFSAPYFHDGSLPTLARVVDWFNTTKDLGLDENARADLTAYLEAVGDADEPYQVFEGKETEFRLAFDELTTFATTLNTLLPMKDKANIKVLVETVAPDLKADASTMKNLSAKSEVYQLANLLHAVGIAVANDKWADADANWQAFQALQNEVDERMY